MTNSLVTPQEMSGTIYLQLKGPSGKWRQRFQYSWGRGGSYDAREEAQVAADAKLASERARLPKREFRLHTVERA